MTKPKSNPYIGSSFDDFLREEGMLEEATAVAVKRVLAWELQKAMKHSQISKAELARRMRTSRAVVHRLLDAEDSSVTLATIVRATLALDKKVRLRLGT
jgi:antitoxin HicB